MRLEVQAVGERVVSRELLRMAGRADDVHPAMEDIRDSLYQFYVRQFDSQGGEGGARWEAIQQRTIDRKVSRGKDPRVLHESLRLRKSLTGKGGENVAVPTGSSLVVDSTVPYAGFVNAKRPITGSPPESYRRDWVRLLQSYIVTGEARGGRAMQPRNILGQWSR